MALFSFLSKKDKEVLDNGLDKTKTSIFDKISRAISGKSKIDDEIIERLEKRIARDKYVSSDELHNIINQEIVALLSEQSQSGTSFENLPSTPYIILVVGVNGVGKTTTIGKLANRFKQAGKKVFLGAADTFRAAAIDQLMIWGQRVDVTVIKHKMGADPASVVFDTLSSAKANNAEVVIIDTAGRRHNKVNLMNELTKIRNVVSKVLLVLDGSTGQNAYEQARQFSQATNVTALAITKLDGTARGGVVIGISDQMQIPVKYIGLGEGIDDIQVFDKEEFVKSLFDKN